MPKRLAWYERAAAERWMTMWEKHRRLGFFGFVMVWGFGVMGLGVSALLVGLCLAEVYFIQERAIGWDDLGTFPLPLLSGFIPLGILTSLVLWFQNEQRYRQCLKDLGREPDERGMS